MNIPFINSQSAKANSILCSIHDSQSERWTNPLCFPAVGAAIRAFTQACDGGDKQMTNAPGDFTLYTIGSYDDQLGIIKATDPVRVVTGLQVISSKQPQ